MEVRGKVESLIVEGKLLNALDILLNSIDDDDVLENIIVLTSRLKEIEKEKLQGTISVKDYNLEKNRIRIGVFKISRLLGEIKEQMTSSFDEDEDEFHDWLQAYHTEHNDWLGIAKILIATVLILGTVVLISIELITGIGGKSDSQQIDIPNTTNDNPVDSEYVSSYQKDANKETQLQVDSIISRSGLAQKIGQQLALNYPYGSTPLYDSLLVNKDFDLAIWAIRIARSEFEESPNVSRHFDYLKRQVYFLQTTGYDQVYFDTYGLTITEDDGLFGLYDSLGNEIIKPVYEDIDPVNSRPFVAFKKSGKWGFLDKSGQILIPPMYDHFDPNEYGDVLIELEKDGQFWFLSRIHEKQTKRKYTSLSRVWYNSVIAIHNNRFGMIDTLDNIIIPFEYDDLFLLEDDVIFVGKKGEVDYFFDSSGQEVKNPIF